MKNVKSIKHKISAAQVSKLHTPTDLSERAKKEIANCINPLVADAFALHVKTKNFHWHLSGSHYSEYHKLFDEQAEQIFNMIDILAERLRKIGMITIHSIEHIKRLQRVEDDNDDYVSAPDMISRLMSDNKNYASQIRAAHEICSEHQDFATTSVLEVFLDETEKRVWFLHASSTR